MAFKECKNCSHAYHYENPECKHCRNIYLEGRDDEYRLIKNCIDSIFKQIKGDDKE